jgi:hypothetical protein
MPWVVAATGSPPSKVFQDLMSEGNETFATVPWPFDQFSVIEMIASFSVI